MPHTYKDKDYQVFLSKPFNKLVGNSQELVGNYKVVRGYLSSLSIYHFLQGMAQLYSKFHT